MSDSPAAPEADENSQDSQDQVLRCDLCGDEAQSVRRIALDGEYDRLRKPHEVMYACASCSEKKERQRLGLDRGSRT